VREKIHVVYERKMVRGAKEKRREVVAERWEWVRIERKGGSGPQGVVTCEQKCGTGMKRPRGLLNYQPLVLAGT